LLPWVVVVEVRREEQMLVSLVDQVEGQEVETLDIEQAVLDFLQVTLE